MFGRSSTAIWEFEGVVLGSDGFEYARLVRTNDRGEHKLISLIALLDRSLNEPI